MRELPESAATSITRRRFILIAAAATGATQLPTMAVAAEPEFVTWQGTALGASATLVLQHRDTAAARSVIEACLAEVARLETIFSLYRPDSALSRLNATGVLDDAPADLRQLLAEALHIAGQTDGAFDPTIQPLWALYARHFDAPAASADGPERAEIVEVLKLVDWRNVEIDGSRVRLALPGMALTLNGIAQGYITDKVGDLLRRQGFENVLVNMGEQLALGPKWDGSSWRIGIAEPSAPGTVHVHVPLSHGALATSGGYGFSFDPDGRVTHILDPSTGRPAKSWASVTVVADRATLADGLSTALAVAPPSQAKHILGNDCRAYGIAVAGQAGAWI